MIRYYLFPILASLFISFNTLSQTKKADNISVEWGEENPAKAGRLPLKIVGEDGSSTFLLKRRAKMGKYIYILERYDQKLHRTHSQDIDLETNGKKLAFEECIYLNNKIYFFSSFYNQKSKKMFLFSQSINPTNLTLNNDLAPLIEITNLERKKSLFFGQAQSSNFNSKLSEDKSKLVFFYEAPTSESEVVVLGARVFDQNITELWGKDITLPYKNNLFHTKDYIIDNHGNLHLLNKIYKEKQKTKSRKGTPNYNYQLLSINNEGLNQKKTPISLGDQFITDMKVRVDKNKLTCSGFYSDENSYQIKGTYVLQLDLESQGILSEDKKDFDIDFITLNMTDRQKNKTEKKAEKGKNVELYEYDLDEIIVCEDGSFYMLAEQYYIKITTTTTTTNGQTSTRTTVTYYYNDIIVAKGSKEGKILWVDKIPKRQKTSNDKGSTSSYVALEKDGELFIIFNDHKDNLSYTGQGKLTYYNKKRKQSAAVLVHVSADGKSKKNVLYNLKEEDVYVYPLFSFTSEKNKEILLYNRKGKIEKLVRCTPK